MFLFVFLYIEVVYLIRKGLLLEVAQRRPSPDNSVKLILNFNLIITSWCQSIPLQLVRNVRDGIK
jgi:hypothetical protein